jgi:hypothetical protein
VPRKRGPGAGRPTTPIEIKRRRGTAPAVPPTNVVQLRPVEDMPEPPADLQFEGRALWAQAWQRGVVWLAPLSDTYAVLLACRLADNLATAREVYSETRDPADGRMITSFAHELASALASLGFDPSARTKLGVAEVTRVSKLAELRRTGDEPS